MYKLLVLLVIVSTVLADQKYHFEVNEQLSASNPRKIFTIEGLKKINVNPNLKTFPPTNVILFVDSSGDNCIVPNDYTCKSSDNEIFTTMKCEFITSTSLCLTLEDPSTTTNVFGTIDITKVEEVNTIAIVVVSLASLIGLVGAMLIFIVLRKRYCNKVGTSNS